jgi:hypothetical protein
MPKELYEELLGKEAPEVFEQALQRHLDLLSPNEVEALQQFREDRQGLSESHKEGLNDLMLAISDDFSVRRRAVMIKKLMTPPVPDEDDWIPGEGETEMDQEKPPAQPKKGGDEESLEDFLESMEND